MLLPLQTTICIYVNRRHTTREFKKIKMLLTMTFVIQLALVRAKI